MKRWSFRYWFDSDAGFYISHKKWDKVIVYNQGKIAMMQYFLETFLCALTSGWNITEWLKWNYWCG